MLHRDGTLADERDGQRVGAHAMARDAGGRRGEALKKGEESKG
jgi:hypothetical protein